VARQRFLKVPASQLHEGDRIRVMDPPAIANGPEPSYYDPEWRVLGPPVPLASTSDVMVRLGIRTNDRGVSIRFGADEWVTVARTA